MTLTLPFFSLHQPDKPTWNLMGMLNNPWFRVKIAKTVDPVTQAVTLQFEHPTLAGMCASIDVLEGSLLHTSLYRRFSARFCETMCTLQCITQYHTHMPPELNLSIFLNHFFLILSNRTSQLLRKSKRRLDAKNERAPCSNHPWCVRGPQH